METDAAEAKPPTTRRRAASMELRLANRRSAAALAETGEAPAAKPTKAATRASRVQAAGGGRLGPKARAARATLAAQGGEVHPEDAANNLTDLHPDHQIDDHDAELEHVEDMPQSGEHALDAAATDMVDLTPSGDGSDLTLGAASAPAGDTSERSVALVAPPAPVTRRRDAVPPPPPAASPAVEMPALDATADEAEEVEDDHTQPGGRRRMGPRAEKRAARAAKSTDAANYVVAPPVSMAEMRPRHYSVIALFVLMVLVPTISYSWYLWTKAADQYESNVGFASRTEDAPATFDFLGALGGIGQGGPKDMDILYQYIVSQELVSKMDRELDLKAIYSKAKNDPLNAFKPDGTIEDLLAYWQRMVKVNYDNGTGLMTLQVFSFDPVDSQKIAQMILVESTKIINDLSMTAQEDTTRYAKDTMTAAEKKLSDARLAVLDYQVKNGIVDPSTSIANQNSIIGNLNQQLAQTQVELDMLSGTVGSNDLRIATLNRKLEVIKNRIAVEQAKVGGATDSNSPGYAKLVQDFERLKVDQDFAERAYLAALAAYDQAVTDAQHKTRYLATYVAPTLAEASTAPSRPLTAFVVALIGFLIWAITVLFYYALRDRR